MRFILNSKNGFTYIEFLIIVIITAAVGAMMIPFASNFTLTANLESTKDKIVSSIRKAQNYSIEGKNGAVWGVCLSSTNKIRMYRGTCAMPSYKEDYDVPPALTMTGLTDTQFSLLRGEPSTPLNISLVTKTRSYTLVLNMAGGLDY